MEYKEFFSTGRQKTKYLAIFQSLFKVQTRKIIKCYWEDRVWQWVYEITESTENIYLFK